MSTPRFLCAFGFISASLISTAAAAEEHHAAEALCPALAQSHRKSMGGAGAFGFGLGLTGFAPGTVLLLVAPSSDGKERARRWVSLNIFKIRADGAMMGLKGAF